MSAALKFTRIKSGYGEGDYTASSHGIEFSIVRCVRPVRFALTATRDGHDITRDIGLRWGTYRAAVARAERILGLETGAAS